MGSCRDQLSRTNSRERNYYEYQDCPKRVLFEKTETEIKFYSVLLVMPLKPIQPKQSTLPPLLGNATQARMVDFARRQEVIRRKVVGY